MHPFKRSVQAAKIICNPSIEELRAMASHEERLTRFGSASFISRVRNRSAKNTFVIDNGRLGQDQQAMSLDRANKIADAVHDYLKNKEIISLDRQLGVHQNFRIQCRLYITKEYSRIPLKWQNMLFKPDNQVTEPDLTSIYVPEWPERCIFVHPEAGVTYILGTDYFGEAKKAFLRMALYMWKKRGGIGFHAGSKVLRVRTVRGALEDIGLIMFGLSGTGKTTLTIHNHLLKGEEAVIIRQDDVVMMDDKGYCYGTENGFYIKTEGLDQSQKVLYQGAISPNAILENVKVSEDGSVLFDDNELTTNGRCVVLREEVLGTDDRVDLDKAHRIIFITRRDDIIPPVARLNAEQAAAYFMLGESIETSAGDPTKAGHSKREVGTNPFMIGPESEEGNRLLEILRKNPDMECYLLNTGSVGLGGVKPEKNISIMLSSCILKHIAKGTIKWKIDPGWGYEVPVEMPEVNFEEYNPVNYFTPDDYHERVSRLRRERLRWLAKYPGLKEEIIQAIL